MIESVTDLASGTDPFDTSPRPITDPIGEVVGGSAMYLFILVILIIIGYSVLQPLWNRKDQPIWKRLAGLAAVLFWFVGVPLLGSLLVIAYRAGGFIGLGAALLGMVGVYLTIDRVIVPYLSARRHARASRQPPPPPPADDPGQRGYTGS